MVEREGERARERGGGVTIAGGNLVPRRSRLTECRKRGAFLASENEGVQSKLGKERWLFLGTWLQEVHSIVSTAMPLSSDGVDRIISELIPTAPLTFPGLNVCTPEHCPALQSRI